MDYLESLRIFRSVVESKSFTKAADMHGVPRPSVSRTIAALEERIGCRLLNRNTRQVSLTEEAEQFYEGCVRVLEDLDALEAGVANRTQEAGGVLRLVAHTTATIDRLIPLIAAFKRAHPKVSLDVTLTERPVDLIAEGYDLGIVVRYMVTSDTTVIRQLERIPVVIVATPGYLKSAPPLPDPMALTNHQLVLMSASIRRQDIRFRDGDSDLNVPRHWDIGSNSPTFNREMVLQGFGIGIVPRSLVENELASGKLVQVLTDFQLAEDCIEIMLAYSNRTLLPVKVRAFIDFASSFFDTRTK